MRANWPGRGFKLNLVVLTVPGAGWAWQTGMIRDKNLSHNVLSEASVSSTLNIVIKQQFFKKTPLIYVFKYMTPNQNTILIPVYCFLKVYLRL